MRARALLATCSLLALVAAACNTRGGGGDGLSGTIEIDGSSTVFPITEAIAEEYLAEAPGVNVTVGFSGTGGGFEKFCNGETAVSDASRPINDEEAKTCRDAGVGFVEARVAIDGLTVVVNSTNDFVECLTVDELREIWEPGSTVTNWSDVRDGFPDLDMKFYSPGADSGTFDYFTDEVVGEAGAQRTDDAVTTSENDDDLVTGVDGDHGSLGYFGYAYYIQNRDKLTTVAVDGGDGCVTPTDDTIEDGTYSPLSRPLFIYPSSEALAGRPEVADFVSFYLDTVGDIVADVGYIPVQPDVLQQARDDVAEAIG